MKNIPREIVDYIFLLTDDPNICYKHNMDYSFRKILNIKHDLFFEKIKLEKRYDDSPIIHLDETKFWNFCVLENPDKVKQIVIIGEGPFIIEFRCRGIMVYYENGAFPRNLININFQEFFIRHRYTIHIKGKVDCLYTIY